MKISTKLMTGFGIIIAIFSLGVINLIISEPQKAPQIITIIAAASVTTILIVTYLSQSITTPINEIRKTAEEIKRKNFKARAKVKSNGEIQELAEVFNKAAEVLQDIDEKYKEIESAKTRFLSITSHELRSPMTPMKAQLQMLEKGYFGPLTKKQKESVKVVINNADKLDKIIADFLEVSRIEAGRLKFELKKTDIGKTIKETIELMQAYDPDKKIKIETQIKELPRIETDPDRISQVLRNLISNAIKFSPKESTIVITAEPKQDNILITVTDQGIGISEENQKRLFEPFFQAEKTISREYGGVGLGLSITKGIIQSQGGKIWVKSPPGKGTTFFFTIPKEPTIISKPIKLLFSEQEQIEKEVQKAFTKYLGPIAKVEFEDLKSQGITETTIKKYVTELKQQKIIDYETAEKLKMEIKTAFQGEKTSKELEEAFA